MPDPGSMIIQVSVFSKNSRGRDFAYLKLLWRLVFVEKWDFSIDGGIVLSLTRSNKNTYIDTGLYM